MSVNLLTILYFVLAIGVGVILGITYEAIRKTEERSYYKRRERQIRRKYASLHKEIDKLKNELVNEKLSNNNGKPDVELFQIPDIDDTFHKPF